MARSRGSSSGHAAPSKSARAFQGGMDACVLFADISARCAFRDSVCQVAPGWAARTASRAVPISVPSAGALAWSTPMRRSRASVAWAELVALVAVVGVDRRRRATGVPSAARAREDAARPKRNAAASRSEGFVFERSATHCSCTRSRVEAPCVVALNRIVPKPAT